MREVQDRGRTQNPARIIRFKSAMSLFQANGHFGGRGYKWPLLLPWASKFFPSLSPPLLPWKSLPPPLIPPIILAHFLGKRKRRSRSIFPPINLSSIVAFGKACLPLVSSHDSCTFFREKKEEI